MAQSKFKTGANTNMSCRHIYWWLPQRSPTLLAGLSTYGLVPGPTLCEISDCGTSCHLYNLCTPTRFTNVTHHVFLGLFWMYKTQLPNWTNCAPHKPALITSDRAA